VIKLLISGGDIGSVLARFLIEGGAIAVILIFYQRKYFALYYQTQKNYQTPKIKNKALLFLSFFGFYWRSLYNSVD
jgi:hypothetical protein